MPAELDRYIRQRFRSVGLRLFHAENLHDFAVYCRERALLARTELRRLSAGFTTFYSDQSDEERGALSRVFGNLRDFGVIMACCERCQHAETFILSKFDRDGAKYVAMESGHPLVDPTMAQVLMTLVARGTSA